MEKTEKIEKAETLLEETYGLLQEMIPIPPQKWDKEALHKGAKNLESAWIGWYAMHLEEIQHIEICLRNLHRYCGSLDPSDRNGIAVALHSFREIETLSESLKKRLEFPFGQFAEERAKPKALLDESNSLKSEIRDILSQMEIPKLQKIAESGGDPKIRTPEKAGNQDILRLTVSLQAQAKIENPDLIPREYCRPHQPDINAAIKKDPKSEIPGVAILPDIRITLPSVKKDVKKEEKDNKIAKTPETPESQENKT